MSDGNDHHGGQDSGHHDHRHGDQHHDDEGGHHDHGDDHHHHHGTDETLDFSVLTVSTSRSADEDESGPVARRAIEEAGHTVSTRDVLPDDENVIRDRVQSLVGEVDVVVTTGGTGLTDDDVTVEALTPLFDPEIPGVGEYFRRLSHDQIGTAAMLTRATAGIADETAIYAFPGSPDAIELGVEDVLVPEVGHVVGLARR